MKDFRTELFPRPAATPIKTTDQVLTIGSCFADAIGRRLTENKFRVCQNPFGTLYHPHAIHRALGMSIDNEMPGRETYVSNDGLEANYLFHSSCSSPQLSTLDAKIKETLAATHTFLKSTDFLLITYGTAWVHELKPSGLLVSNCHKMPAGHFSKRLLTLNEIHSSFAQFQATLKSFNPRCRVILTVSPVRHLKETLEGNAASKSLLRYACHQLVSTFSDVVYFPAYEIQLDDLRDYRFYQTDRLHPTDEAVDYIWEKFTDTFLDEPARQWIQRWQAIQKSLNHRGLHPASHRHREFLQSVLQQMQALNAPFDLSDEMARLQSAIQNS